MAKVNPMVDWILILAGLVASRLLFWRFPFLNFDNPVKEDTKVTVIIPVRNEEDNIGRLLEELIHQNFPIARIICVDDCSTDNSSIIIKNYPVTLITVGQKPEGWIGKSYACHLGARQAKTELLLFVDSDVSLKPGALQQIIKAYANNRRPLSVLPYHEMVAFFEQQSLFFNLVQAGSNGVSLIKAGIHAGLYGPVILIDKQTYETIGTHETIRQSIVDDVALGHLLNKSGVPFDLYLGGDLISYRMYRNTRDLYQGWIKNYATGAQYAPPWLSVLTFLWIASLLSVTIMIARSVMGGFPQQSGWALLFYLVWLYELNRISLKIGNFKKWVLILFPGYIVIFVIVFLISLLKKVLKLPVVWKNRKIRVEK